MKDSEIYLVRHGETEWNRTGRVQGHLNSDLTQTGRMQAKLMGECLGRELQGRKNIPMVCSPLGRARQTADIICQAMGYDFADCLFDTLLMERNLGDWNGMTIAEVDHHYPAERAQQADNEWDFLPPSGESFQMMAERLQGWLSGLDTAGPLIVVCHGAAGRVLRGLYGGLSNHEVLGLSTPQDAVFRLALGGIAEIPVAD